MGISGTLIRRTLVASCAVVLSLNVLAGESNGEDWIDVGRSGRELWAIDGASGRRSTLRLATDEAVLTEASGGGVAVFVTSDRALGISAGGGWAETRWGSQETVPNIAYSSERIGLVLTNRRILGIAFGRQRWAEERIRSQESISGSALGDSVAVVVTGDRALALAVGRSEFASLSLGAREVVQSVSASDRIGTVQTDRFLHTFSATRGWSSTRVRD